MSLAKLSDRSRVMAPGERRVARGTSSPPDFALNYTTALTVDMLSALAKVEREFAQRLFAGRPEVLAKFEACQHREKSQLAQCITVGYTRLKIRGGRTKLTISLKKPGQPFIVFYEVLLGLGDIGFVLVNDLTNSTLAPLNQIPLESSEE